MQDLLSQPGMEPGTLALKVRNLSHWTTREILANSFLKEDLRDTPIWLSSGLLEKAWSMGLLSHWKQQNGASETGAPLAPLAPRTERLTMTVSSRMQQGWRESGHQCLDLTHGPPSCCCSRLPVPASLLISRVPVSLPKKRAGWKGKPVHPASKGNFQGATTEGEITQPGRRQESGHTCLAVLLPT